MAKVPLIEALRTATYQAHRRLETDIDLERRLDEADDRADLVEAFHRLHAAAEPGMAPWLARLSDPALAGRERSGRIAEDLAVLGRTPTVAGPVAIDSAGAALGWLYVLEGSSLGGKVIHRGLRARGLDVRGLGFLDPYGEAAGERWRGFIDAAVRAVDAGRADEAEVIEGAQAAFALAQDILARPAPDRRAA